MTLQAWKVQEHREPGRALDQCPDGGAAKSEDEIAFPLLHFPLVLGSRCTDAPAERDLQKHLVRARKRLLERADQRVHRRGDASGEVPAR